MAATSTDTEIAALRELAGSLNDDAEKILEQVRDIEEGQAHVVAAPRKARVKAANEKGAKEKGAPSYKGRGDAPPIAFVHIPKTAGATVTTMLIAAYTKQGVHNSGNFMRNGSRCDMKLANFSKEHVTVGHVPYRMIHDHLPEETLYMTFMREPVDRVMSHYFRHVHREKGPKGEGKIRVRPIKKDTAASIEDALAVQKMPRLSNLATRFLCDSPTSDGPLPDTALEEAKANLRQFAFIGIQEDFDESVRRLRAMLGLGEVPFENRHVSAVRPSTDDLSPEDRALILESNQLDIELYELAVELYEAGGGDGR